MKRRDFLKLSADQRRQLLREQIAGKVLRRSFTVTDRAIDEKARTVDLSFSSDEPYERWRYTEILSHADGAVLLDRLNGGGALLSNHDSENQIGVVVPGSAHVDANKARATVRFSQRQAAQDEFQDVIDGIRTCVSVGYVIHEYIVDEKEETLTATRWEPLEISLISIPADTSVGVGRSLDPGADLRTEENEDEPAVASTPKNRTIRRDDSRRSTGPRQGAKASTVRGSGRVEPRKSMKRKLRSKPAIENEELCREGDPDCGDESCLVHYEEDTEQRETAPVNHAARFRAIAEAAALGDTEKKRFLQIASDRALADEPNEAELKKALLADRKKHAAETTPDPEDPEVINARTRLGEVNPRSLGVGRLKNFKTPQEAYRFGKFLAAGVFGIKSAAQWCRDNGMSLLRAHSESDNESGGIWVPTEFDDTFILLREQFGLFRGFADVTPMTSDHKVRRRQKGGLTANPVGAVGAGRKIKQSQMKWDAIELVARKWGVLVKLEEELLEDTIIAYADKLVGEMAYAFAKAEDDCGFNGDGSSTFHGIVGVRQALRKVNATIANIKGLIVGPAGGWTAITQKNLTDLIGILPEYADDGGCAFYCHRTFYWSVIVPIRLAAGGVTLAELSAEPVKQFLGYPVQISQIMPKTTGLSQICLLFGDLDAGVTFGDRRGITVRQTDSNDVDFEQDLISMKATERFDINVHDVGDTTDPGPVVGLITAAS